MRIALFTDGIHPYVVGGIQRHSFYLCKFLAQKGVQVDLYHYFDHNRYEEHALELFTEEEQKNITSYEIEFPKHSRLPGHYVRESKEYSARVYAEFLKHREVDFVYSKNYTSWKYLEEKNKGVELPPIGVKLHGYEAFQIHTNLRDHTYTFFHKPATIFNTNQADLVFSYGGKITEIIHKNTNTPMSKIVEIPSAIDPAWLDIQAKETENREEKSLVFLGRYTKRKGIHFINKWIEQSNDRFHLSFIGPIPEEKQIDDSRVTYHGMLSNSEEVQDILVNHDVLLCPSLAEGMPNVILEGMATGCAIVATDVGASSIMVNHENGWLIQPNSQSAFNAAMDEVLASDKSTLDAMKKSSKQKIKERFNWNIVVDEIINVIKGVHEQ